MSKLNSQAFGPLLHLRLRECDGSSEILAFPRRWIGTLGTRTTRTILTVRARRTSYDPQHRAFRASCSLDSGHTRSTQRSRCPNIQQTLMDCFGWNQTLGCISPEELLGLAVIIFCLGIFKLGNLVYGHSPLVESVLVFEIHTSNVEEAWRTD